MRVVGMNSGRYGDGGVKKKDEEERDGRSKKEKQVVWNWKENPNSTRRERFGWRNQ